MLGAKSKLSLAGRGTFLISRGKESSSKSGQTSLGD